MIVGLLVIAAAGLYFHFFIYDQGKTREPSPTDKVKLTIKPPAETRRKTPLEKRETRKEKIKKPTLEKSEDIPKKAVCP